MAGRLSRAWDGNVRVYDVQQARHCQSYEFRGWGCRAQALPFAQRLRVLRSALGAFILPCTSQAQPYGAVCAWAADAPLIQPASPGLPHFRLPRKLIYAALPALQSWTRPRVGPASVCLPHLACLAGPTTRRSLRCSCGLPCLACHISACLTGPTRGALCAAVVNCPYLACLIWPVSQAQLRGALCPAVADPPLLRPAVSGKHGATTCCISWCPTGTAYMEADDMACMTCRLMQCAGDDIAELDVDKVRVAVDDPGAKRAAHLVKPAGRALHASRWIL